VDILDIFFLGLWQFPHEGRLAAVAGVRLGLGLNALRATHQIRVRRVPTKQRLPAQSGELSVERQWVCWFEVFVPCADSFFADYGYGNAYTTTSYGAQGGADGGGFMVGEGGSSPAGGKVRKESIFTLH
jgi:hypothetical protein